MAPLMRMPAQLLANLVGGDAGRPLRVLDVAAGHGMFGITIAERHPQAHVTALDWKNVLAVAQENAGRAGVADRYALLPGSAFDVDWGGPYDVVLLTNFLHHFDAPTCEGLARRAFAALAPGGRALTLEFVPDKEEAGKLLSVIIGADAGSSSGPIDAEARKQVVQGAAGALAESYVYPELGASMGKAITASLEKGEYDTINDERAFAEKLTKDLQAVSHDKHLRVRMAPKEDWTGPVCVAKLEPTLILGSSSTRACVGSMWRKSRANE